MTPINREDLSLLVIKCFVDKPCWYSCVGGTMGTAFVLAFGKKHRRHRPLTNSALSAEYILNRGESEIDVYCSWRVFSDGSWFSSTDNDVDASTGLALLEGDICLSAVLCGPCGDLLIRFKSGRSLDIFCDNIHAESSFSDNWTLNNYEFGIAGVASGFTTFSEVATLDRQPVG